MCQVTQGSTLCIGCLAMLVSHLLVGCRWHRDICGLATCVAVCWLLRWSPGWCLFVVCSYLVFGLDTCCGVDKVIITRLSSTTFHDHWRHFSIITSTNSEELGYSDTSSYTWSKKFILSRDNYISSHYGLVRHHDTGNLLVLGNASQCLIVCSMSKVGSCFRA